MVFKNFVCAATLLEGRPRLVLTATSACICIRPGVIGCNRAVKYVNCERDGAILQSRTIAYTVPKIVLCHWSEFTGYPGLDSGQGESMGRR